ncbi:MAG TPA: thioredoxin domain-containing protein [archaeon]|nr:thioredoxin domain-containing protein [archaeon]
MSETVTIKKSTLKIVLIAVVAFAIGIGATYLFLNPGSQNTQETSATEQTGVSLDDDPAIGSKDASIAIVEFSDFQCGYCRLAWKETIPSLLKNEIASGKVKLVYRDFPIQNAHPSAVVAAVAAQCANEQGKFIEMHDKIFSEQQKISDATQQFTIAFSEDDVKKWTSEIGLDMGAFNSCLSSDKYITEIEKDLQDGVKAGVTGTPTFFIGKVKDGKVINPVKLPGAYPYSEFKKVLDTFQ